MTYDASTENRLSDKKINRRNIDRNYNTNINQVDDFINISESSIKFQNNDFNSSRAETLKLSFDLKEGKTSKNFKINTNLKKDNVMGINTNASTNNAVLNINTNIIVGEDFITLNLSNSSAFLKNIFTLHFHMRKP